MSSRYLGAIILTLLITPALASEHSNVFEDLGEIQEIELTTYTIKLYNKFYKLSPNIKINNVDAIYSLKKGCKIAYSGQIINSTKIINSLYIIDKNCLK